MRGNQVELRILAKPNAKRTALLKADERGLHIALHAKPQEGEANRELIAYLAKFFKVPKSQIILLRGESSRHKVVVVPFNEAVQRLLQRLSLDLSRECK